jgi:hypothetical protein
MLPGMPGGLGMPEGPLGGGRLLLQPARASTPLSTPTAAAVAQGRARPCRGTGWSWGGCSVVAIESNPRAAIGAC